MRAARAWGLIGFILIGLTLPAQVHGAEPETGYAAIQHAFLREEFDTAASLAQQFIAENPDSSETPRVWLWMALSLDRLEQTNDALKQLDLLKARLRSGDALWPEVLFWEGEVSRQSLQMVRAKRVYQRLLQSFPDSMWAPQAQLGLGLVYLHQQAFELALEQFHGAAVTHAGSSVELDALVLEGIARLRLEQFQEAATLFDALLHRVQDPLAVGQVAFYFGESLSGLKRYDEAVPAYQLALGFLDKLPPNDPLQPAGSPPRPVGGAQLVTMAQFGLGWAYYQLNRCEESLQTFERYLTQAGAEHRTEAMFAESGCLLQAKREDEALSRLEQIVSRDPQHALALESGLLLIDASLRQNRLAAAKELVHQLLREHPDQASRERLQLPLGKIALAQGNAAQAQTVFELAAQSGDAHVRQTATNGLGDVQLFLGNLTTAKELFEKAMQMAPETQIAAYARYQIGRLHLQLGAPDQAVQMFQTLLTNSDPSLADDARLALVVAYLNQREPELARALLDDIRTQEPDSVLAARAAYYAALLALDQGDEATAQRWCRDAIDRAPRTEEAFEAEMLLVDLWAREKPAVEVIARLTQLSAADRLPPHQQAKVAKRLGDVNRAERQYARAVSWYEQAAALSPSLGAETAYRIGSCHEEAGDFDEAVRWYRRADQPPWRVRGLLASAKLFERQDRPADAEAIYEQLAAEPIPEARMVQERLAALREETSANREERW